MAVSVGKSHSNADVSGRDPTVDGILLQRTSLVAAQSVGMFQSASINMLVVVYSS